MSLLAADDLTVAEWRLCVAAGSGELLDLQTGQPEDDDPRRGGAWGTDRQVRAQVLYQLLTGRGDLDGTFGSPVAVRLEGAAVLDPLRLSLLTLRCPLQLLDCYLAAPLDLTKTHAADVALQGSHLNGLAAQGISVTHDLDLRGCTSDYVVVLAGAHIGGDLDCSNAQLTNLAGPALLGDGLTVDGIAFLRGLTATGSDDKGAVRLPGARIGGNLACSAAALTNDAGPALYGDGLTVDGSVHFTDGFTATGAGEEGAVRLIGAHIGGQLTCNAAELTNETGPALTGDVLTVGSGVFLTGGFTATGAGKLGAVRLLGADIGGQLACHGAQFTNLTGPALFGDGLTVGASVFFDDGFTATGCSEAGAVRLPLAHIGGDFNCPGPGLGGDPNCPGAKLTNDAGPALAGDGLTIDGNVFLAQLTATGSGELGAVRLPGSHIRGQLTCVGSHLASNSPEGLALDLRKSALGSLRLALTLAPASARSVALSGLTYNGIPASASLEWWLTLLRDHHSPGYEAQPWQQLAATHRAAGHEGDTRRILIAQQDARRARMRPGCRWAYLWLSKLVVGYGYQTWRAAIGLMLILTAAAGLGVAAGHVHTSKGPYAAARTNATAAPGRACSTVEQIGLGVDLGLPLIKTNVRAHCDLDSATTVGGLFTAGSWFLQALSWAAATLVAAGYTAVVRRT